MHTSHQVSGSLLSNPTIVADVTHNDAYVGRRTQEQLIESVAKIADVLRLSIIAVLLEGRRS
jgi:hypothetical protein